MLLKECRKEVNVAVVDLKCWGESLIILRGLLGGRSALIVGGVVSLLPFELEQLLCALSVRP